MAGRETAAHDQLACHVAGTCRSIARPAHPPGIASGITPLFAVLLAGKKRIQRGVWLDWLFGFKRFGGAKAGHGGWNGLPGLV